MTQKSESVKTIEDLIYEFTLLHEPACKISRQAISDGLMLLVQNAITLLAEEAGREAHSPYMAEIAAWLREKAC